MIAVFATYMLVFQSIFGALAYAAGPTQVNLDAFGNPLCITSTGHDTQLPDAPGNTSLPKCCTTACSMFSLAVFGQASSSFLQNPLRREADVFSGFPVMQVSLAGPDYDPGNPRAPPAIA